LSEGFEIWERGYAFGIAWNFSSGVLFMGGYLLGLIVPGKRKEIGDNGSPLLNF